MEKCLPAIAAVGDHAENAADEERRLIADSVIPHHVDIAGRVAGNVVRNGVGIGLGPYAIYVHPSCALVPAAPDGPLVVQIPHRKHGICGVASARWCEAES